MEDIAATIVMIDGTKEEFAGQLTHQSHVLRVDSKDSCEAFFLQPLETL